MLSLRQNHLVPISPGEYGEYEIDMILTEFSLYMLLFSFLNSAFEDETMKLRQLKLDNQVSKSGGSLLF